MSTAPHITILSGGGSPHVPSYRKVYEFIEEEAARRGVTTHLIDYVGVGHHPEIGAGLSLPASVEKARQDIAARPAPGGSTLLCRSFGCDVGAYLLAYHGDEMTAFSRVILWGPSAYHTYWDLVARTPDSLRGLNAYAAKHDKGMRLHDAFWDTFEPIEESSKRLRPITVDIGFGSRDPYCDGPFAHYLAGIIWKHTSCSVRVVQIEGAEHEIRAEPPVGTSPEDHERIKRNYFALIFRPDPESGIRNPDSGIQIQES